MPYYDQPAMLRKQVEVWHTYPKWTWKFLELILVDDGSPNHPAFDVLMEQPLPPFLVQLYRIQEDIPWNHGGARNLAFDRMGEGWAVLTDIDHILPLESVCSLLFIDLLPALVYIPDRYRIRGVMNWEEIERHSDSFILTRERFWGVGGFDEDFSGYWNGVSGPFRKALKRCSGIIELTDVCFHLYGSDVIQDASVGVFGRKGSEYDINMCKSSTLKRNYSRALKVYSPKNPLRFNWEQVI